MTSTEVDREQDREQYVHSNTDTFCLEGQAGLLEEGGAFVLEQWAGFWEEEGPEALQAGWWGWSAGGHWCVSGGQVGVLPLSRVGGAEAIRMTLWRALEQHWGTCPPFSKVSLRQVLTRRQT